MAHLSNSWFALLCLTCFFCTVKGRGGTDDEVKRKWEKQAPPFKVLFQYLYEETVKNHKIHSQNVLFLG